MTNFTVLAYRQNGVDSCRNCVMNQSDSDFHFSVFGTIEAAATEIALIRFKDQSSERHFCNHEISLLVDGSEDHEYWVDDISAPYLQNLNYMASVAAEKVAYEKQQKELAGLEQDRLARETRELAEYKRLQEKFGDKL